VKPVRFYLLAAFILVCDQVSKWAITRTIPVYESLPLSRFFSLTHTRNTGGAFSLLQAQNGVFVVVAAVAMVALVYSYHRFQRRDLLVSTALSLALGGALGNLIDRLRFGYVIDFFDLHYGQWAWPVFNVADSAITVAILMLAWHFLFHRPSPSGVQVFRCSGVQDSEPEHPAPERLNT